jgi:hypothetical protein
MMRFRRVPHRHESVLNQIGQIASQAILQQFLHARFFHLGRDPNFRADLSLRITCHEALLGQLYKCR